MAIDKVQFFRETCHLQDDELLEKICSAAVEKTYRPKERILQPGKKPTCLWFLVSGVIRSYCFDEGGKEITDMFISQPGSFSNNVLFNGAEIFGEKAVNDVVVLEIPGPVFEGLLHIYPDMRRLYCEQVQNYAIKYWYLRTVCSNMLLSEQLKWFRKADPISFEAANNVQLASFFGATRESVSRLLSGEVPGNNDEDTGALLTTVLEHVAKILRNESPSEKVLNQFPFVSGN